jgi:hypothetical protein
VMSRQIGKLNKVRPLAAELIPSPKNHSVTVSLTA